jgi:hypothetical protein
MSKRRALIFVTAFILAGPTQAFAASTKNHTGGYLFGMVGMTTLTADSDREHNVSFGSSIAPAYGLTIGGNITNAFALEFQIIYATDSGSTFAGNGKQHAGAIRLNGRYSFLTKRDYESKKWRLFPYVKLGAVGRGSYITSDNSDDTYGIFGGGFATGGGVEATYGIVSIGLDVINDFVFFQTTKGPGEGIEGAGFGLEPSVMATLGFHF